MPLYLEDPNLWKAVGCSVFGLRGIPISRDRVPKPHAVMGLRAIYRKPRTHGARVEPSAALSLPGCDPGVHGEVDQV